ncbi:LacI family DNA-binding transcriptional regulator [Jonesiaceae bacterium BS-20]|uniref:LacI family DNA-binding transcriptional regulator n=1 Tax=Jonesiaceae bacterium BS-20 TaxID=3120821 RepID=A0AAU7DUR2_9MICO
MPTVRDVAKLAGVSISTVSRALSMPHMVNPGTRALVITAAEELGYQPNAAAQGLRSGVTKNIGLVIPDLENPFFATITKGVQARARNEGYAVFIADSDEDTELELRLIANLSKQVDGLILASPRATDQELLEVLGTKPLVLLNRKVTGLPAVIVDNQDGIAQAIGHLRALGHTKIAFASGPAHSWSSIQREVAVREFASQHPEIEIIELGNFRPYISGGLQVADLAVGSGATALVTYNDLMALGVIERLRQREISVPQDFSVVGIDGISLATLISPALTTVQLPLRDFGRKAVDFIVNQLANQNRSFSDQKLGVELEIRDSTDVPVTT